MSVVVVGLNQRTVPLELLEQMTVPAAEMPKALADLSSRDHIGEVVVLSTCMRTEIYVVAERYHGAIADVRNFLGQLSFQPPETFGDHLYAYHDDVAVAHLFKVAAGLDSAVLGEGEVLGQVRDAWDLARDEGTAGAVLGDLFRHALEAGKRARSETAIARGTTSLSQAAVALAIQRVGTLSGKKILVLGAGDMGEGMAVALASSATEAQIQVANRTQAKAEGLAGRVGATPIPFESVMSALSSVDVVLTSTGSPATLVEAAQLAMALPARAGRELLIVDLAVPRDIEPAVADLPGVTLLDMDDITAFAEAGMSGRRQEVERVKEILAEEVSRFLTATTARQAAPLVTALRDHVEALRVGELERYRTRLQGLGDREREAVESLTRSLLAKVLHEPTVQLKEAAGSPRGDRLADALRQLFDL